MVKWSVILVVALAACSSAGSRKDGDSWNRPVRSVPRIVLNTAVRDSQVFRPTRLGRMYRYGSGELQRDVFIYPRTWPDLPSQAKYFLDATEIERNRGKFTAYKVESDSAVVVNVTEREIVAHEVILSITGDRSGAERSYFAVADLPGEFVKVRITRPGVTGEIGREFMRAWLEAYLAESSN